MAQGRTRLSPGDFTGREKNRVGRESAEEQTQRSAQIAMASAAQEEVEQSGVHDPQSGALIERFGEEAVEVTDIGGDEDEPIVVSQRPPPSFGGGQDDEPILTGQEPPEVVEAVMARYERPQPETSVQQLLSPLVVIRTDEDVDRMTYGMRNGEPCDYSFKAGLAYKVPREIAQHLKDRDLIRSFH